MKRIASLAFSVALAAAMPSPAADLPETCYLFSYFTGNGEDGLHLAWSRDGYRWEALKGGKSFLRPEVGESKLMRDPHLFRGPDGLFHLVWTTSWGGVTIGHATSKDLLEWSPQQAIPVMAGEQGVKNCWAPEAEWDPVTKQFVIFWASTVKGKFTETLGQAEGDNNHRMWFTTTKDFRQFAPAKVWLDPGFNVIDATFLKAADGLRLIVKDETAKPAKKNLRMIDAKGYAGPFGVAQAPFTRDWVEGPTCLQVGDSWVVYYDCYRDGHYGAIRSKDLKNWEDVGARLSMPKGIRHGTAIAVPGKVVAGLLEAGLTANPAVDLTIKANRVKAQVAPTMHGLFFEDINYAADGGLYAELVENRSFEHRDGMHGWTTVGTVALETEAPLHPNNPRYVRLGGAGAGVGNGGFGGIVLKQGAEYRFTVHARGTGTLAVRLEDGNAAGKVLASGKTEALGKEWAKQRVMLKAQGATDKGRLVVTLDGASADVDMVSLFPVDTWKKRENGMRADLVQVLLDMKPGFLRFPGGCIVEGKDLANAYRWKDTVGPVEQRKQNWNRWQDALPNRKAPQYYQTYGLGFFEFFQLCEDLGCEPVPVLNCGMSCQFQDKQFVPVGELDPWVQDALDLIEFANGPVSSKWGKLRAEMGHPEPFGLKILGVGNEQWGPEYFERYLVFEKAIRAKHPALKIASTAGPGVDDGHWNYAWGRFRSDVKADIVDEHYYRPPNWFLGNHARYDKQDRKGPKIFVGEFAGHEPDRGNTLRAALAEAVGMTGMLRNADVVVMASYAPLLAKYGDTQWAPDLIWFDNSRVVLTPSYHAQSMFSRNRPDVVVEAALADPGAQASGRVGVGTWNSQAEFRNLTVKQGGKTVYQGDFSRGLGGGKSLGGDWEGDGALVRQKAGGEDRRLLLGPELHGDFVYELQARKTGGEEGFLILFDSRDDGAKSWWNIGGWRNSEHAVELAGVESPRVKGRVEQGKWHDIRIESEGATIRCFLDGKLVHDARQTAAQRLYVTCGLDTKARELIVHAVNPGEEEVAATLVYQGMRAKAGAVKCEVMSSGSLDDRNSLEADQKVRPVEATARTESDGTRHVFPARSLTVLRIPAQ